MFRYPALFLILGLLLGSVAWRGGLGAWAAAWLALDAVLLSVAYGLRLPRMFGKRPDGSLAWWSRFVFGPHLFFTWLIWRLSLVFLREDCCNRIAPGLWLGRRPYAEELPSEADLVVDLTAEFPAAAGVARGRSYLCEPMLDGTAGEAEAIRALVRRLAAWPGVVYVHCAQGHGRSAMVAAAVLLARGVAADAPKAMEAIKTARPGVGLNPEQEGRLAVLAGRPFPLES